MKIIQLMKDYLKGKDMPKRIRYDMMMDGYEYFRWDADAEEYVCEADSSCFLSAVVPWHHLSDDVEIVERKERVMHECTCRICGRTFLTHDKRRVFCSRECRVLAEREWTRQYAEKHRDELKERRRLSRQRKKAEAERERAEAACKPDTIMAEGYAERQMAETLRMAGKIDTRL